MKNIRPLAIFCLIPVCASLAHGSVRLENRDLFVKFQDLVSSVSGQEFKFERVYNSKSAYSGWFGPHWGSTLETRLVPQADGALIIRDYGGGAELRYDPAVPNAAAILDASIRQLVQWAASRGTFGNESQKKDYASHLRSDARFREAQLELAVNSGKILPPAIRPGEQFVAARFQYQYVTRTKDGFTRRLTDGSTQVFTQDGKLVEIRKGSSTWDLRYDARGMISQLVDPAQRVTSFHFGASRLLERIDSPSGSVEYSYDAKKQLVSARSSAGKFLYSYDPAGRHLLLDAVYPDGTRIEAKYEDLAHQEDLRWVRERSGMTTEIRELSDSPDGLHRKFQITETTPDGHPAKSEYEYFERRKADGERWIYRKIETIGDLRKDTLFNECCGKPVSVTENSVSTGKVARTTEVTYDGYGREVRRVSSAGTESYIYMGVSNRLTRLDRSGPSGTFSAIFVYDTIGRLIGVRQSTGPSYMLFYGAGGKLDRFVVQGATPRSVNVSFTEQPEQTILSTQESSKPPVKWVLPDRGLRPSPKQKALLETWHGLQDLFLMSNNPLPD